MPAHGLARLVAPLCFLIALPANPPPGIRGSFELAAFQVSCTVATCSSGCSVGGGQLGHTATDGGSRAGFGHSNCWAGNSCQAHGSCQLGDGSTSANPRLDSHAAALELVVRVAEGDLEAFRKLTVDHGQAIRLDRHRQSLQLFDCNHRTLVANVPLTPAQRRLVRSLA